MGKNDELDHLFVEWRSALDANGANSNLFSFDGIIDEPCFEQSEPRILFVLRETNSAPGLDLRCFLRGQLKYQVWRTVAHWAYGILNEFVPVDPERLHTALCQVAVMNLKKITGGAAIDPVEFEDSVRRDRDFISREVDIIDPEVIVSCGERQNLAWILNLGALARNDRLPVSVCEWNGKLRVFLFPRHPVRANNATTYEELRKCWVAAGAKTILCM